MGGRRHAPDAASTASLTLGPEALQGLTRSHAYIFYSAETGSSTTASLPARATSGAVYGVALAGGTPVRLTGGMVEPRGLAWDGDGTIFVANEGADAELHQTLLGRGGGVDGKLVSYFLKTHRFL
eukprot:NODE_7603_length_430_cov_195.834667.p1 GENE.NODE_7603_length_430_cov_195.834667~~NODE_7603_length_430_cov_195.834667.p1  ORF type:complete len:125 (+),score=15.56 NODE_7603_length_430_cov_195.834667:3-377(+)